MKRHHVKPEQPSLRHLQNENKARTRRYFAGGNFGTPGPWNAPEAPKHSQTYVFPSPMPGSARASPALPALGLHYSTPVADFASTEKGGYWRNGYASGIGQEEAEAGAAAGIDLFGTNEGIISLGSYDSMEESTSDDDPDDFFGFDEAEALQRLSTSGNATGEACINDSEMRRKMDEQAAYVCQLEETNLKLQEKIWLLENRVKELAQSWTAGQVEQDGSCQVQQDGNIAVSKEDADSGCNVSNEENTDGDEDARSFSANEDHV